MSIDDPEIAKLYYSIGEVAEMFSVNTSLIRFWEKEFGIIKPKKNKKGNRLFTVRDIENFKRIFVLVKEEGYTLDGAKIQLKGPKVEGKDNAQILNKLEEIKKELLILKRSV